MAPDDGIYRNAVRDESIAVDSDEITATNLEDALIEVADADDSTFTGTTATEDLTTSDDATIGDDLTVTDDALVTGDLTVTTATVLNGAVAVGNATTDLVGFHGATAVDQAAAYTQTYATAARTIPAEVVAITGGESPTEAEHNLVVADVLALKKALNAVIDDLQEKGLVG